MPSPTVLLVCLVFGLGLFGSGVSIGVKWERNDTLARISVAQDTAIKAANAAVAAETERAVAREKVAASARAKAREVRHQGELDAAKKSRPECSRDSVSMGLLNGAIDNANGVATTAGRMSAPVRSIGEATGWLGAVTEKLGIPGGGAVRGVPASP